MIRREFGIRYHRAHVSRLVRALRLSVQRPITRATRRNEATIERWKTERWPALKKAQAEERTIIWVDEAGLYLLPGLVRTDAPCGQTPVLRGTLTRDHLSVIGALTEGGHVYTLFVGN